MPDTNIEPEGTCECTYDEPYDYFYYDHDVSGLLEED